MPLVFTADKPLNWLGYSLDGKQKITLTGNGTIANLTDGLHSVAVYANDTDGDIGRIIVNKSNIVFDGNGHSLTYRGDSRNVIALSITNGSSITVKNLRVIGGSYGISLNETSNTLIVNNTVLETKDQFLFPYNLA